MTLSPEEQYAELVKKYSTELNVLQKRRKWFGTIRLLLILIVLALGYSLFFNHSVLLALAIAAGIISFLIIVFKDADNKNKIDRTENLIAINKNEIAVLNGIYFSRADGIGHLPAEHPYAADLDLFGKSSIYQYINRCTSEQAKHLLAALLLAPSSHEQIHERQEAAKSLSTEILWRQGLQVSGSDEPVTIATETKIKSWLSTPQVLTAQIWKVLPHVFTVVTLCSLTAFVFDYIPGSVFTFLLFIYFLFANFTSGKVLRAHQSLSKIEAEVETIEKQLKIIESIPVSSAILDRYKQQLLEKGSGSAATNDLKNILHRFDVRLNVYLFVLINTFLLWDVRQMNHLNNWRNKHGEFVKQWFEILANVEVLNTLGILTFNHPGWIFPKIAEQHFILSGEDIGHPLINVSKRVNNSFSTTGTAKVNIITGSNMAGKSTFLRSVGVNIVLALMGAPVCAKAFTCSRVHLYSSMRIADNLAENTSTFYAELKKLKVIIDQVKAHEKVFILLDEILRGTNSLDRHTGSEAFIKQMIKENAVAVIATHDVELAKLEEAFPEAIDNYHFDVQVEGEELYFDYKLKTGVCESMNASLLMKKIGIDI